MHVNILETLYVYILNMKCIYLYKVSSVGCCSRKIIAKNLLFSIECHI